MVVRALHLQGGWVHPGTEAVYEFACNFVEHLGRVSTKIYLSTQTELQQVADDQGKRLSF